MATKYTYDKEKDYQAMINEAVGGGDYRSAALYEQQRNQKIADMNAAGTNTKNHQQTDLYSKYLNGGNDAKGYLTQLANMQTNPQDGANYQAWQNALNQYQNSKFEYDFDADPQKKVYEQNAQKNYENTLAQTSARTGGLASSYAGQASQQAYQDTMSEAYQILYNLARSNYEYDQQKQLNMANQYWNAYQNDIDLSNTNWNRLYSMYGLQADSENTAYSRNQDAAEAEKEAAMMAAYSGDYSRLAAAYGITEEQARNYFTAANSSGGSGGSSETEYGDDVRAVAAALNISLSEAQAYKNLGASPWYTTLQQLGLYGNGVLDYVQSQKAAPGPITLPDTGDTVSESEALRLVESGDYVVTGYDKNGNIQLAPAANRTKTTGYTK